MFKLGRVSEKTLGPPIPGWVEDLILLILGALFPCPKRS